jgi:hypothetical protein
VLKICTRISRQSGAKSLLVNLTCLTRDIGRRIQPGNFIKSIETSRQEFNAFWDDKPHGDIRVCGDLSADPQKRLLGFLPVSGGGAAYPQIGTELV